MTLFSQRDFKELNNLQVEPTHRINSKVIFIGVVAFLVVGGYVALRWFGIIQ